MTNKLMYEKPELLFWTDEELNAIEATMSGGGGGGYNSIVYEWREHWTLDVGEESIPFGVTLIVDLLLIIAKRGISLIAGAVLTSVEAIARHYYEESLLSAWYTREMHNLYMRDGFTAQGAVWSYVGCLVITTFYGNASHTWYVGQTGFHNIPSEAEYMLNRII